MSISKILTGTGVTLVVAGLIGGYALRVSADRQEEIVNRVSAKMIEKINSTSCDDLHTSMKSSQSQGETRDKIREDFINLLKANPSLKESFFDQISTPLVTKMFDCGMIPPRE